MSCEDTNFILTSISSILAILLLASELLPYATSSRCNGVLEGISHICGSPSCFISNKNIRIQNDELKIENTKLKIDNDDLKHIIDDIKINVITELKEDISKLRSSFETTRHS